MFRVVYYMKLPSLVLLVGACLYLFILLPVATATAEKNDTNIRISVSLNVKKVEQATSTKTSGGAGTADKNVKTEKEEPLGDESYCGANQQQAEDAPLAKGQHFRIGDEIIADWSEEFNINATSTLWEPGTIIGMNYVNDEKDTSYLYDVKYHDDDSTESNIHPLYLLPKSASEEQKKQRLVDNEKFKVIPLDPKTFSTNVGIFDGSTWLIEFYHRGCQHCIDFIENYAYVGRHFMYNETDRSHKIKIAKVNCENEKTLASRFNIQFYPTFVLIKGWTVYKFEGIRSKENLIKFVNGGYNGEEESDPIAWYESPMGPTGQVKGMVAYSGISIADVYFWYQEKFHLSYITTGILLFIGLFCFWFFGIIAFITISLLMTSTTTTSDDNNKGNNNNNGS